MAGHGRVVWLTTKGRRTGRPRSVAVGFADEPDGSVLVAANDDSTAWARNLLVEPIVREAEARLRPAPVRQGEGEACGTAVEGAMTTTLIAELIKGSAPGWPRIEDDTHWMTVGSSRPMEDSWRIANAELVHWVSQLYGLHTMDAYQLCSQIAEVPVANVVDANYSVVVKAAKALLPAADAFGGMHADLRARARSLITT